jgi:DNA mismatch repair protein MSH5
MSRRQNSVWFRESTEARSSVAPSEYHAAVGSGSSRERQLLDSDDDDSEDVIMAVDQRGSKIGCCYYTYATETLSFMEDISLPSSDCIDALKFQINPKTLLLPSRLNEIDGAAGEELPYRLLIRPSNEFAYDSARCKLIALRIGEEQGPDVVVPADLHDVSADGGQSRGNLLKLAAWVDMESRVTVGCAGAVLAYLQRKKAVEEGAERGGALAVQSVEMFSLRNVM